MNKIHDAQIALKVWENIAKLETLWWARYYKEFLKLMIDQDKANPLNQNTQDFIF